MKEQSYNSSSEGTSGASASREEHRLRMVEHITAQFGNETTDYVRDVINETKAGASRRPTLKKLIETVFIAEYI